MDVYRVLAAILVSTFSGGVAGLWVGSHFIYSKKAFELKNEKNTGYFHLLVGVFVLIAMIIMAIMEKDFYWKINGYASFVYACGVAWHLFKSE